MKKLQIDKLLKRHWLFICICLAFGIIAVLLSFTRFRYIVNPDAVSYFTIAEKYARFDFKDAINGYWGPLFSWLLVPSVWLSLSLDIAARLVNVVIGVVLLISVYLYLTSRLDKKFIASVTCFILSVFLMQWIILGPITPDLLITLCIVLFAFALISFLRKPSVGLGVRVGAIGGLMYFSKGFGLYLFLAVVGLIMLWHWWRESGRSFKVTIRLFAPILIVFAVLTLPFITLISLKYHKFVINEAGRYNLLVAGPQQGVDPMLVSGPFAPPNATAASVWEDPTTLNDAMPTWSPIASVGNLRHYTSKVLMPNARKILDYIYSPLIFIGVIGLVLGALRPGKYRSDYILFGLIGAIMAAGYALVLAEDRYLWSVTVFALITLALLGMGIRRAKLFDTTQGMVAAGLVSAVVLLASIGSYVDYYKGYGQSFKDRRALIGRLESSIPKGSNIISDTFSSYYECYYLGSKCFDVLTPPSDSAGDQVYYEQLKGLGITYYLDEGTGRSVEPRVLRFAQKYFTPSQTFTPDNVTLYKIK